MTIRRIAAHRHKTRTRPTAARIGHYVYHLGIALERRCFQTCLSQKIRKTHDHTLPARGNGRGVSPPSRRDYIRRPGSPHHKCGESPGQRWEHIIFYPLEPCRIAISIESWLAIAARKLDSFLNPLRIRQRQAGTHEHHCRWSCPAARPGASARTRPPFSHKAPQRSSRSGPCSCRASTR